MSYVHFVYPGITRKYTQAHIYAEEVQGSSAPPKKSKSEKQSRKMKEKNNEN